MKKQISITCILLSAVSLAFGEMAGNYYSGPDNEIFVLPASAAMACADMSSSRSTAPLSNPANLANDSLREASLSYASYFQNTYSTSAFSMISPIDKRSGIGISLSYVMIPDINQTVYPPPVTDNIQTATASDLLVRIAYGLSLYARRGIAVRAGAAVNAQRRDLTGDIVGYGIGADAGVGAACRIDALDAFLTGGILVENITTSITRWSASYSEYSLPHARLGLGWHNELPYVYGRFSVNYLSPDLFTNEGINAWESEKFTGHRNVQVPGIRRISQDPLMIFIAGRYGAEYMIKNTIAFRAGIFDGRPSFGGGLRLLRSRAGLDLAFISHELAPTYKLSVNFRWK
ncbi:MAG: hypothetical protein MUF22_08595 [Chitinispirillaceae bacterium]|jgi:hypothetical protein|nr:hypothetical protein [Chitinispirillaceae bacterium]